MRVLKVATCSLNQWAMDFDRNMKNIKESICRAKEAGATIRLGPELEISGYGCEDHFFEQDTITHSWECLKELLVGDWTDAILCSFGMAVMRGSERAQMVHGMEAENPQLDDFLLPPHLSELLSQTTVPFGYGYIQFLDTAVAAEICMELFAPVPIHPELALNGVEVFMNASGSIHLLQKKERRLSSITSAMSARGGVYMYSNHLGCDGGRTYYDGCSCIVVNGDVVGHGLQFSLKDVDLVVAQINLDEVTSHRASNSSSFREQASCKIKVPSIFVPYKLCKSFNLQTSISTPLKIEYHSREEEIGMGAACWLWNYLRRSGASGFLLALSGGVDTCSVAAIVGCMSQLVVKEIGNGDEQVKADAIRIGHYVDGEFPRDNKEFAKRIFYTVFMASENSLDGSRKQSRMIAEEIGSWHLDVSLNGVVSSLLSLFQTLNKENGGTNHVDNYALQSIRGRSRMVVAFMLASLLPWLHHKPGFYLLLSSTTADHALSGNLIKYGCSSGDINPIGNINKPDLESFLKWASINLGYSSLAQVEDKDNVNLGMTEEELSLYARLRMTFRCGPLSMFENLCDKWGPKLSPREIGEKVKHFFKCYSMNRHKMTVLTPSYLVESNSPEDNRFDLRQFLYNARWPYQFRKIDELIVELNGDAGGLGGSNDQESVNI